MSIFVLYIVYRLFSIHHCCYSIYSSLSWRIGSSTAFFLGCLFKLAPDVGHSLAVGLEVTSLGVSRPLSLACPGVLYQGLSSDLHASFLSIYVFNPLHLPFRISSPAGSSWVRSLLQVHVADSVRSSVYGTHISIPQRFCTSLYLKTFLIL